MPRNIRSHWQRHVNQLSQSGLSPVEYAKQQQISVNALYNWRKKLSVQADSAQPASPFVALSVSATCSSNMPCTINLPQGVQIELPQLPEAIWLAALLKHIGRAI